MASLISAWNVSTVKSIAAARMLIVRVLRRRFFRPLAQEGADEPYDSGSFFDGHFKIAAHAHTEMWKRGAEDFVAFVAEFAEAAENGADFFGGLGPGRDGHEAVNFQFGQG